PLVNFTNRYATKHDGMKWIEWTCIPDLEARLIYVIARNVTEFVEREQLLKKSEEKYRRLFNNIQGMVSLNDLDGNFLDVNRAGLKLSGYSLEEVQQSDLYQLVDPEKHNEIPAYLETVKTYGQASGE